MNVQNTTQPTKHAYGERVRYSASLILQAEKQFFSVTMPTNILAKCCYVTSRDEDPVAGFQRVLDASRAKDIAKYIDVEGGTIPGSIILSAQSSADLRLVGRGKTIEFTYNKKAFLVLDGQHRIYGFSLAERALRVPVVIYSGLTPTEEARLFIDINTKQRAVPNELLLDIKQLAQRESEKEALLREVFDLFHDTNSSSLKGLLSPSQRLKGKISRVTFNLAFKQVIPVFSEPNSKQMYQTINAYLSAFQEALSEIGVISSFTMPAVFRAVLDTFPEVARISAAQNGKIFNKNNFMNVIHPIVDRVTKVKFDKFLTSQKELTNIFFSAIKKDFSI